MDLVEILNESPLPKELAFSEAEYAGRVARFQARMVEDGIDVLIISSTPNLGYLTGYDSTMSCGYTMGILGTTGDVALHCSELEAPCALLFSTIRDIKQFYWYEGRDTATQLGEILRDRGAGDKRIGIEMGNPETFASGAFDTESYLHLVKALPDASFVNATTLGLDMRMVKSDAEVAYMRQAGELTGIGLKATIEATAEGRTDNEIVAAGYGAMIAAGSELMSIDPMCTTGPRTAYMPHIPYKRARLEKGHPIYLEYSGCYERYNAPGMRSACIGEPSDGLRRLSDASIATLELLLENIKPGRTGDDVAQIAKHGFEDAPEGVYFHGGYGYSIGMGFQPTWTENPRYIAEGSETVLEPGMTFHLPICTWVPADKIGIGFSESIAVTETGCETLTSSGDRVLAIR
ncbi:MAG: Xaa-Pro peptidase family protein [Pseudomonadota bacterium]|nr:Xaa-Pro peptidase family protein [Pseudomonadota bacterium]